jgi:hypothetical protein
MGVYGKGCSGPWRPHTDRRWTGHRAWSRTAPTDRDERAGSFGDGYSAHGRVGSARRQGPDRPATVGRRPAARMVRALRDGDEENARRGLTSNLIDGGRKAVNGSITTRSAVWSTTSSVRAGTSSGNRGNSSPKSGSTSRSRSAPAASARGRMVSFSSSSADNRMLVYARGSGVPSGSGLPRLSRAIRSMVTSDLAISGSPSNRASLPRARYLGHSHSRVVDRTSEQSRDFQGMMGDSSCGSDTGGADTIHMYMYHRRPLIASQRAQNRGKSSRRPKGKKLAILAILATLSPTDPAEPVAEVHSLPDSPLRNSGDFHSVVN